MWGPDGSPRQNHLPLGFGSQDTPALLVDDHPCGQQLFPVALDDDFLSVRVQGNVKVFSLHDGPQERLGRATPKTVLQGAMGLGEPGLLRSVHVHHWVAQLLASLQEHVRDLGIEPVVFYGQVPVSPMVWRV